jgi:hypothetical protein
MAETREQHLNLLVRAAMIGPVYLLALAFKAQTTLRLKELAWLAVAIGGALLVLGGLSANWQREGQLFGGLALGIGGVIAILAFHYGK